MIFPVYLRRRAVRFRKSPFFRFVIVGSTAFAVNAITLELSVRTGAAASIASLFAGVDVSAAGVLLASPVAWAAGVSAECSIAFSFTANNLWTFSDRTLTGFGPVLRRFAAFNLTSIGAIVIEFVTIGLAAAVLGDEVWIRQAALAGSVVFLVVPYNWFMYNAVIWGKPQGREERPVHERTLREKGRGPHNAGKTHVPR